MQRWRDNYRMHGWARSGPIYQPSIPFNIEGVIGPGELRCLGNLDEMYLRPGMPFPSVEV